VLLGKASRRFNPKGVFFGELFDLLSSAARPPKARLEVAGRHRAARLRPRAGGGGINVPFPKVRTGRQTPRGYRLKKSGSCNWVTTCWADRSGFRNAVIGFGRRF
jgi:hypothetical protein